jgi:hypothetical protein
MRNSSNVTPKDQATMAALTAMEMVYNDKLDLLHNDTDTPAFKKAAKKALAIMHNKLLEKSGFDGRALPENL